MATVSGNTLWTDLGLLIIRVTVGATLALHGAQKLGLLTLEDITFWDARQVVLEEWEKNEQVPEDQVGQELLNESQQPFQYSRQDELHYSLIKAGPDGEFNTEDDLNRTFNAQIDRDFGGGTVPAHVSANVAGFAGKLDDLSKKLNYPYNFPTSTVTAWAATSAEFLGGLLLVIGLLPRTASLFVAVTMFVAVTVHLKNGFFSGNGGFEYPLVLGLVAVGMMFTGAGVFSIQGILGLLFGKKKQD